MTPLNAMQPGSLDAVYSRQNSRSPDLGGNKLTENVVPQKQIETSADSVAQEPPESGVQSSALELDQVMQDLNDQMERIQNYLRFEKDADAERMVIYIKNRETDEVIRQIPSQEFLAISRNISQFLEMRQQLPGRVATPTGLITNETA